MSSVWAWLTLLAIAVPSAAQSMPQTESPTTDASPTDTETPTANPTEYSVIHVNAAAGSDRQGDGSQLRPLRTITHALDQAEANSLILLADGIYSEDSGETFPLTLKPGVTVQGLAGPNVMNIVIRGSGNYYSASSGLRNVTVVGANGAGLANVTVSNAHVEGTGLWIESGSPFVLNNAFFQNGANGVYIAGSGSPVIRGNLFSENGQAGLVIAGPSTAQVQSNVFENTGVGITIAPEASPQIVDNRISRNLDGVILHADARPTLRNNEISRNRRNTILDYANWTATPLATPAQATQPPPPTTIAPAASQRSAHPQIATATETTAPTTNRAATTVSRRATSASSWPQTDASSRIPVPPSPEMVSPATLQAPATSTRVGHQLAETLSQNAAALDRVAIALPTATSSVSALSELNVTALSDAAAALTSSFTLPPSDDVPHNPLFSPLPERGQSDAIAPHGMGTGTESAPVNIPVPPPNQPPSPPALDNSESESDSLAVPISSTIPSQAADLETAASAPNSAQTALRVPNLEIPVGTSGDFPAMYASESQASATDGPPPPPSLAAALGLHYKVLVAAADASARAAVQAEVPDAFRVRLQETVYMQVGAYPTRQEAQALVQHLQQAGLEAHIHEVR